MGLGGLVRNLVLGASMLSYSFGCGSLPVNVEDSKDLSEPNNRKIPVSSVAKFLILGNLNDGRETIDYCHAIVVGDKEFVSAKHCYEGKTIKDISMDADGIDINVCLDNKIKSSNKYDVSRVICKNDLRISRSNLSKNYNVGDAVHMVFSQHPFFFEYMKKYYDEDHDLEVFFNKKNNKYVAKGRILDISDYEIRTNIPSMQQYSGAGLFNENGDLIGILSSGTNGYILKTNVGDFKFGPDSKFVPISKLEDVE